MPQHLRQHIQLTMDLREKLLSFERTTTSYSCSPVYKEFDIGRRDDKHDEAVPMDVDRIEGKDKGKAQGKGKGKDGRGKDKGKGYGSYNTANDKGKGKGKSAKGSKGGKDDKGKKGLTSDVCKLLWWKCYWSRECPVRTLRQVSDSYSTTTPSGAASAVSKQSSATKSDASVTAGTETILLDIDEEDEAEEAEVRMVSEASDLTYSDEDGGEGKFEHYMDLVGDGSRPSDRCFVRCCAGRGLQSWP